LTITYFREKEIYMDLGIQKIDAIILCGGLGRRLRKVVNDRPKCMADINGRPFLNFLIEYLSSYKIKKIILCLGYLAGSVKQYYDKKFQKIKLLFSEEEFPLGTAGAIRNAATLIESNPFLVLNGDSICKVNLFDFLIFHKTKEALVSVVLCEAKDIKDTKDFGVVKLDRWQRIVKFCEKPSEVGKLINGGIYLFDKAVLKLIPKDRNYSLEYDLFWNLYSRFYGYITHEKLIDIGTPERYKKTKVLLRHG
jgi:NDP-sugar pyrophosphorylase family protein